jgi:sensor histidine kinase YesM
MELVSFLTMMPLLALVLNLMLFKNRVWTDIDIWLYSYPLVIIQGFISWYLHIIVMHWLRFRYPLISQTSFRLTVLALAHIGLTSLTFASLFFTYHFTGFLDYTINLDSFKLSLLVAIALTMIATTLWESEYTFDQLKTSIEEKQRIEELTIHQEFESLKSQVNPHFLFNCFNALSSLITEDHKQAEVFLDELSKVYRYLLRNNSDGLSTLGNEIRFIRSYYQLLNTRYGEGLQLNIEIDKRYDQYVLPSLSLQLLVENAVKHNVVLKSKPLVIDIFTAAGNILIVNNNLQPRQSRSSTHSTRIGLENIKSKYELIKQKGFQVMQDNRNFSVVLPLIWQPVLEHHTLMKENAIV